MDGMGSKIGYITNIASASHCIKHDYEEDSPEFRELDRRGKIFRRLQGSEIDKAKTGESQIKIPDSWSRWSKDISEIEKKLVADKRPYFTRYLYDSYDKKYRQHLESYNKYAWSHFHRDMDEIILDNNRNRKEQEFLDRYYKYSFFLFSKSPMNKVCWHMEKELDKIHTDVEHKRISFDYSKLYSTPLFVPDEANLKKVKFLLSKYISAKRAFRKTYNSVLKRDIGFIISEIGKDALEIASGKELGNLGVYMISQSQRADSFVWNVLGDYVIDNVLDRYGRQVEIPIKDEYGDIEFMFSNYSSRKIFISKIGDNTWQ